MVYLSAYPLLGRTIRVRNLSLLAFSYAFYWWLCPQYLPLLILVTVVSFAGGWLIARSGRPRLFLALGLLFLVGLLAWFKFWEPVVGALESFRPSNPTADQIVAILVPLGISYYTFQAIGYLIDVYRRDLPPSRDPVAFALYLAFFPKLLAGPLTRSTHMLPQSERQSPPVRARLWPGLVLILGGLVKKLVIAEHVAVIADFAFTQPSGLSFYLVLGAAAFYLQLYADFSGYTDIARGTSRMLGFELPPNFDRPYLARSPSDFWRRWHVSLSEWFRDYVYIPLGGSRRGLGRTVINLLATMLLVGLWHGTRTTYLLWGLYWGFLLAGNHAARFARSRTRLLARLRLPRPAAVAATFAATSFGWILFRSESLEELVVFLRNVGLGLTDHTTVLWLALGWSAIVMMDGLTQTRRGESLIARPPVLLKATCCILVLYVLMLATPIEFQDFLYQDF